MHTSEKTQLPDLESLIGQASDEFLERLERGEFPDIEEYVQRYPAAAGVLRRILPALQAMRAPTFGDGDESILAPLKGSRQIGDFRIVREIGSLAAALRFFT